MRTSACDIDLGHCLQVLFECVGSERLRVLLQQWGRVPALNTNPTFIDDLAAMVLEKLPSAAPRPGYVPSLNETMNLGPPTGAAAVLVQK